MIHVIAALAFGGAAVCMWKDWQRDAALYLAVSLAACFALEVWPTTW